MLEPNSFILSIDFSTIKNIRNRLDPDRSCQKKGLVPAARDRFEQGRSIGLVGSDSAWPIRSTEPLLVVDLTGSDSTLRMPVHAKCQQSLVIHRKAQLAMNRHKPPEYAIVTLTEHWT